MDVPLNIDKTTAFVTGMDELKQDIYILLKNSMKSFLQSTKRGAGFSIHAASEETVKLGVEQTLTQINNLTIRKINVNLPEIFLEVVFKGDIQQFQFNIEDENQE